jgi:hypothetical protein
MNPLVEQGLLDRDEQVAGRNGQEDVGDHALLHMMMNGPQRQGAVHVAKGVLGAGQ